MPHMESNINLLLASNFSLFFNRLCDEPLNEPRGCLEAKGQDKVGLT